MNTKTKKLIIVISITTALTITSVIPGFKSKAQASDAGAFFGGMLASHVIGGAIRRDKQRTEDMNQMAYSQQESGATYAQPQAAPAAQPSAEDRINQLNKLAAGGYITPEEYKAKKQAIVNGL